MDGMNLEQFDYHLPKELIAQESVRPHDHCKLLILDKKMQHAHFYDLPSQLQEGDVLVINQTKVLHAKLSGRKSVGGGKVELILTKQLRPMIYEARIKGAKMHIGTELEFSKAKAKVTDKVDDIFTIEFSVAPSAEELQLVTPPYIKKKVPENDYQTMFARTDGSLAAPTASLHFTPELMEKIKAKGVKLAFVTLHIGFGTFLPVKDLAHHKTEPEFYEVPEDSVHIINEAKRVIAVGTTVLKTLESSSMQGKVFASRGWSNIFIKPGFPFQSPVAAIVTNFHLPQSSLLLLICGFAGKDRIMIAYQQAIEMKYRFYSLGDAMFVTKQH